MTRRYFGTDGIRGKVGEPPVTADFVLRLGYAAGMVLAARGGKGPILVGKDTRISGYMFESALEAGLIAAGVDVGLTGPMPTPAIAYLTRTFRARAGIVISASHNPYDDNGIKFFGADGHKLCDALEEEIERALAEPLITCRSDALGRARRIADAPGRYIEYCKATFPAGASLAGIKLVVDCANGATYHVAPDVFRELGAEVAAIGVDPDGFNINAGCGSTHPEALRREVVDRGADLGVAFDGDGDRVILVDHRGRIVDGDQILYIAARHRQARGLPCPGVVGTVMSNLGLERALARHGMALERAAVGDRHVVERMRALDWPIGGETSGHVVFADLATTGDGVVAALQVLAALVDGGRSLAEWADEVVKLPQATVNVRLPSPRPSLDSRAVRAAIAAAEARLGAAGRVVVRPSGTEPVLRVTVEGEEAGLVEELVAELAERMARLAAGCEPLQAQADAGP
ncbi:MAG: phosphoglucosamine mutase [Porticoccaceae bacterium]|nr:MAG: phosphoglucosamine mutase [Porticoccaceae bacterium]